MSKNNLPLVSIIIPVYNGANYMREAIDSALAQTYPNIEILVINDGSQDDGATHDIAMSYGNKIRYFEKENGGVVSALNFGIDNMLGKYFSWLSHDDLYMPDKIAKQVAALEKHTGSKPAFCICNCTFINSDKEKMYDSFVSQDCPFDKPECFLFLGNVGFNGIMVLIPKVLFDICGKFKPSLATHEYDMWIRIMHVADVVVVPKCLTIMRMHANQVSSQKKNDASIEIDKFMGDGIKSISHYEFAEFMEEQIDAKGIDCVLSILNSYMWYQNFPHTAEQTLIQLKKMCEGPSKYVDDLFTYLLGHKYIDGFKDYFKTRLESSKPLVLFYCENLSDYVFTNASIGLSMLSQNYEIVVFYQSSDESCLSFLLEAKIIPIPILNYSDWFMPLRTALLSYLLNTKIFWSYSTFTITHTQAFHYFKIMKIYSIASFHNIDEVLNTTQAANHATNVELYKNLSKSSVITSNVAPFTYFSYSNLVLIPNNSLQSFARWKVILDAISKNKEFQNIVCGDMFNIVQKSLSFSEYINNYISSYLLYVDKKAADCINSYEQRFFWKLTNPLRRGVAFLRKCKSMMKRIKNKSLRSIFYHVRLKIKAEK